MPRRTSQKMTPVEGLVVVAIIGILISILGPALSQSRRHAHSASRRATSSASSAKTEGQHNTIAPPRTAQQGHRQPAREHPPAFSWIWSAVFITIVVRLLGRLRRGAAPFLRKAQHRHPPDAEG